MATTLALAPLYGLWAWLLATGGGDLAAQLAWAGFAHRHPASPYDLAWYGGMHSADYSVLTPLLMAYAGVRTVSVAAGLVSTWAMAALFVRSGVRRPLPPALVGGASLWCDIASGRTTFAVGVAFALLAVRCVQRAPVRWTGALACATLTALSSPVAALFLGVVGAGYAAHRRWRAAAALSVPPVLVLGAVAVLFPFQGEQLMHPQTVVVPLVISVALIAAAPRHWRTVRAGAVVYALGLVATACVDSPVGTNVERLASIAGLPLAAAALAERGGAWLRLRREPRVIVRAQHVRRALALTCVLTVGLGYGTVWLTGKTISDLRVSTAVPAWAAHTEGVTAALHRLNANRHRVEVVPARDHREAAALAPDLQNARGWNRQLDVRRGRLFYGPTLSPAAYRGWLDAWAVGYVVLPHGRIDGPAKTEAALVRSEPGWLRPVWRDPYWTVYRVADPTPLAAAPADVLRAGEADVLVRLPAAGATVVRVAWSPWLSAAGACVSRAGPWTRLTAPAAGDYRLRATYRRSSASCP